MVIGCSRLCQNFSSTSFPGHPQDSNVSKNQKKYHQTVDVRTSNFSWFRCEGNPSYYGKNPRQPYVHEKTVLRHRKKMMKRPCQSLHPVISYCRKVEENCVEANERNNLKGGQVAGAGLVAKVVYVHWLCNQAVGKICNCQRDDEQIQALLKLWVLVNRHDQRNGHTSAKYTENSIDYTQANKLCKSHVLDWIYTLRSVRLST